MDGRLKAALALAVTVAALGLYAAFGALGGGGAETAAAAAARSGGWRFPLGPGRALVLDVPQGWEVTVRRPVAGPPTILAGPAEGRGFRFLVTPLPAGGAGPAPADGDLREYLRRIGSRLAQRSVEGRIELEPVPGAPGAWFYRLTDRDPGEGFRHLAQGARRLDGIILTFTFLSHVPDPPALRAALRVVATARAE